LYKKDTYKFFKINEKKACINSNNKL